jgi:uncharacterized protein YyaL (SSP411 family)
MASFPTNPDGSPTYTNRLKQSLSPYLRQHAHNPVDWYPWGPEALQRAKKEQKPILVSIGYATCYWCHVMEREVFNNESIAETMNRDFINIKVDREERPELDDIYMMARQLLTREGGWPNNIFLTPDLKPFFAGGTFSVDRRYGRMGFPEVLAAIAQSWENKRDEVEDGAKHVTDQLRALLTVQDSPLDENAIGVEVIQQHVKYLHDIFDAEDGGFYQAPKFPYETNVLFLLDYYRQTRDPQTLKLLTASLDAMAAGGIFDHVGGGFHRYAVDEKWRVPHFEKMLYTQALLALCYLEAYDITGKPYYDYIARSTLDFVLSTLTSPEGVFYSALDAETDAVEGEYYVWALAEINSLLSSGAQKIFFDAFGLEELPQFPGHKHAEGKVIYAKKPLDLLAEDLNMTYDGLQTQLDKILGKLLLERNQRTAPLCDNKIITAWNGLMIHAFARAGQVLGMPVYTRAAERAADFIMQNMTKSGTLYRIWHNGKLAVPGFLEDYAYLTRGLLALYEATRSARWLDDAVDLINRADDLFLDKSRLAQGQAGFFLTVESPDILVRMKTSDDDALPAANAVMVFAMSVLERLTVNTVYESDIWEKRAFQTIQAFAGRILSSPQGYTHMLHARMKLMALHATANDNRPPFPTQESLSPAEEAPALKTPSSLHYLRLEADIEDRHIYPGSAFRVRVTLHIANGWHINIAQRVSPVVVPTAVTLRGPNVDVRHIEYPAAHSLAVADSDESLPVYEGEANFIIHATLKRTASAGEIEDMRLLVRFQACNASLCLEASDIMLELPTVVSSV